MRIRLFTLGNKMPAWVQDGYQEYATRLPHECRLELCELELPKRGKNADIARLMQQEAEQISAQLKSGERLVALDVRGKAHTTEQLADRLRAWQLDGRDVALLIGGPDGLAPELLQRCEERWSLSALTLPHPLVRIVVAEALYRAWTVTVNHPYHRA